MPLTFEERGDGYRVCRGNRMLVNLITRQLVEGPRKMPLKDFEKLVDDVGMEAALARRDEVAKDSNCSGNWEPLPREECMIHSAIGALTLKDIDEILSEMPKE